MAFGIACRPERSGRMTIGCRDWALVAALVSALVIPQPEPAGAASPRAVQRRGELSAAERSTIAMFDRVAPSVVQVVARSASENLLSEEEARVSTGTGFIWDEVGHVVTNDHVVQGAQSIAVRLASGEVVKAEAVGVAPAYDLAVIRIRGARQLPPAVAIGSSSDLKVGQFAFAIGNPFGLDQSLTSGIISALKRRLPTSNGREIANVIQTDAAVNPGNSGGPLLDSSGRVIGVTTAIISPSGSNAGIGFAIPIDTVNRIVPELIEKGRVPTPGIGIVTASEAIATRLGVEGVLIVQTTAGSPAAHAGLRGIDADNERLGDVVVGIDGKPVRRLSDLTDEIERVGVGKTVHLSVKRGDRTREVDVEVVDISRS
jgi:2-alkenal reductase